MKLKKSEDATVPTVFTEKGGRLVNHRSPGSTLREIHVMRDKKARSGQSTDSHWEPQATCQSPWSEICHDYFRTRTLRVGAERTSPWPCSSRGTSNLDVEILISYTQCSTWRIEDDTSDIIGRTLVQPTQVAGSDKIAQPQNEGMRNEITEWTSGRFVKGEDFNWTGTQLQIQRGRIRTSKYCAFWGHMRSRRHLMIHHGDA